ncbi:VOC family protein [Janthinobacterium sp. BJB301]|nr:VOC family protein [Janthinobacterium lividum]KHA76860.1 glyoxalase [Janthinobacterium lividum]PHV24354.1 VOC family protein [Janthinobacterium sp. BJB446]PHV52042.1 VOC family protein [Janthinobacterium sp. BJB301]
MLDHIGLNVSDAQASKAFFSAALAPLGVAVVMEEQGWVGLGKDGKPDFWFGVGGTPHAGMHLAFAADNRAQVDAFYKAALEAGGKDNGAPGIRALYHPNYYGAFVLGPDGHNVEAVCHHPEP